MQNCGVQVFKVSFWMWHHGSKSAKRTVLWSPSPVIAKFWTGKLNKAEYNSTQSKRKRKGFQPVKKYIDKHGKSCWQGTPKLTDTGTAA